MADPDGFQRSRLIENPSTRFFLITSNVGENVVKSIEHNVWATQLKNEEKLNEAFKSAVPVILIFSVNKSGALQGYARMQSLIGRSSRDSNPFGGPVGALFDVDWLRLGDVEMSEVQHLRNSLDNSRQVSHTRDGQELDHRVGSELCRFIDLAVFQENPDGYEPIPEDDPASEKPQRTGPSPREHPAQNTMPRPGPPGLAGYGPARPPYGHVYPHPYGPPPGYPPPHYPPPNHYHHHHHHVHSAYVPPARPLPAAWPPPVHAQHPPPHAYAAATPLPPHHSLPTAPLPDPRLGQCAQAEVVLPLGGVVPQAPQSLPLQRHAVVAEEGSYYSESEEEEKEAKKVKKAKKKAKKEKKKEKKDKKEKKAKKEKKDGKDDAPDFKSMSYDEYLRWWHATHPGATQQAAGLERVSSVDNLMPQVSAAGEAALRGSIVKPQESQISSVSTAPAAKEQGTKFPVIVLD